MSTRLALLVPTLVALAAVTAAGCDGKHGSPAHIDVAPADQSAVSPAQAVFSVVASGSPEPTYQWSRNGVAIPGATGASYTVPFTYLPDDGAQFTVTVTNRHGTETSAPATLHVSAAAARYAFTVDTRDSQVETFAIGSDGALTFLADTPATATPVRAAVDPLGRRLYVTDPAGGLISGYTIGSGGTLTPTAPPTFALAGADQAVVDPSGRWLLVTQDATGTVWQLSIGADGALAPASQVSVPGAVSVAVDPLDRFVYVTAIGSTAGTLSGFALSDTAGLVALATPSVPAGVRPTQMAIDPTGRNLYVIDPYVDAVLEFGIGDTGTLVATTSASIAPSSGPVAIVVDPTGNAVYVGNQTSSNLSAFRIGTDGMLGPIASEIPAATSLPPPTPSPSCLAVDPMGRYLYVSDLGFDRISAFTVQHATFAPLPMSPAATFPAAGPQTIVVTR